MFGTTLDILYFVLSIGIALFAIFGSVALFYLIFILRDLSKASHEVKDLAEKLNEFVYQPIKIALAIADKVKPIIESMHEKVEEEVKKKKKKK